VDRAKVLLAPADEAEKTELLLTVVRLAAENLLLFIFLLSSIHCFDKEL